MSTATDTKPWWDTILVTPPSETVDPDVREEQDTPPADVDVCDGCQGTGSITTWHDPFKPWLTDSAECNACDGTGSLTETTGGAA